MFYLTPPQVREATVFSSLPDEFRRRQVRSAWADANRGGTAVDSFLEGPVFDAAGRLYVTDIPFGRVFRVDRDGHWTLVVEYDGEPNGMKFVDEDKLLIADYKNGLMLLDVERGRISPHLERRNSQRFKGLNDLVFDSRGNLYFTDQGQTGLHDPTGCVFRLQPGGQLDLLLHNAPSPNGIVLSEDERFLYVAMTRGNCVWRAALLPDGSASKAGQFFTSYGPAGPDGLAMDVQGRLLVANTGLGLVWVLNGRAEPEEVIRSPAGTSVTNLAFDPLDRTMLYITESVSASILRVRMAAPGCSLHRPRRGFLR